MRFLKISLLCCAFALLVTPAYAQKGGGGGSGGGGNGGGSGSGGGGGSAPAPFNPFVGEWIGDGWVYDFTFKKDYTFTLVEIDLSTGLPIQSYAGTYDFSLVAPDGYPILTMMSRGEIIVQQEFLLYHGLIILERGPYGPSLTLAKKPKPSGV